MSVPVHYKGYANHCKVVSFPVTSVTFTTIKMVDKVLEGKKAEAMLVGIPVLMIVLTVMVRISMRVVNKVKKAMKVREL